MPTPDLDQLRAIKTLPSLVKYLRDELDWPIEADDIEDVFFDYSADELGLDAKHAAKIKEVKQLRPLDSKQPWGIFWINFEKKSLPMVVLRRVLGNLITKNRASANKANRPSWRLHDLLFISFSHFLRNVLRFLPCSPFSSACFEHSSEAALRAVWGAFSFVWA